MRLPILASLTFAVALTTAVSATALTPTDTAPVAAEHRPAIDHPGQTSDGVPGIQVGPRTSWAARTVNETSYEIVPGVTVREWDQVDGRKPLGRVRLNLVTVDLDAPNITFEHLGPRFIPNRKATSTLAQQNDAFMAVNGDFFDISDTGAPLGVAVDRERGLLHGGRTGWIPENASLWFNPKGRPRVSPLSVQWSVRQFPRVPLSGVNQPYVPRGMVGVYTAAWGKTPGRSVTDPRRVVREVVIRRQRVISNRPRVSKGRRIKPRDKVLIGVGPRARARLKHLRKGKRVSFRHRLVGGRVRVAISGDRPLLLDGERQVINDQLAHPRTAIGIDRDARQLLFLVVDGRSEDSRGFTMVELADLMTALGADDALNLDGGGSSTLYARHADGTMGLINEPSDGQERLVPNAFGLVHDGPLPPVTPPIED